MRQVVEKGSPSRSWVNHTHTSALQAEYDPAIGLVADATTNRADKWKRARGMAMGKQPKRDYSDKTRIDLNQPYQVAYWKQRFGVSDEELEDAVQAVGTLIEKIEAYLKSQALEHHFDIASPLVGARAAPLVGRASRILATSDEIRGQSDQETRGVSSSLAFHPGGSWS